eukprot:TRINITY_DN20190_c0_g2_i1.p1 TRINITY_DN20190_c0_g2~~TRINITY_DN20190_c0_g2_i1.p1  ORF type:complete len:324 (+),score=50.45 TRINITY_DN20190_c0_g2_i1:45-974(+)
MKTISVLGRRHCSSLVAMCRMRVEEHITEATNETDMRKKLETGRILYKKPCTALSNTETVVVEWGENNTKPTYRSLHFNQEHHQYNCTVQSMIRWKDGKPGNTFELKYLSGLAHGTTLASTINHNKTNEILCLGCGAGVLPRLLHESRIGKITCVEVEQTVITAAKEFFGYPTSNVRTVLADGSAFLRDPILPFYNMIFLDAYENSELPASMSCVASLLSSCKKISLPTTVVTGNLIYYNSVEREELLSHWGQQFKYLHLIVVDDHQSIIHATNSESVSREVALKSARNVVRTTGLDLDISMLDSYTVV